jgi:cell division protein FtsB
MSSKLLTTVLALVTIVPFGYITTQNAMEVTDTLHKQNTQIVELKTESEQLDKKLETTQVVKEQTKQEVQQLDQQTQDAISERQKLEAELGVN